MFGNIKNPELSGDFEIKIRVGKQKLSAWLNVPFLVQIAHLSKSCEKSEDGTDCMGNYFDELSQKIFKGSKGGSLYSKKSVTEVDEKELREWCKSCKINYYHYQFLHVEKCSILNDPLDINSWEKKVQKLEEEEEK
mmetsp:Transcript_6014/g.5181  ORF Transcript_6014/g.5181 Transcript_6014/m.5181 type:complete len:136 (+) Transcript_6014:299-706(+)